MLRSIPMMASAPVLVLLASPATAAALRPGDHVRVYVPGNAHVHLATTDAAWDELIDAQNARSAELLARLAAQGKVIMPLNGTRATVIEARFASAKVMITDGPFAGEEGWIQREFAVPESDFGTPAPSPPRPPGDLNHPAAPWIALLVCIACCAGLYAILRRRPPIVEAVPDWRTDPEGYRRWRARRGRDA